jgi:type IV pilus assembly protein PilF
MLLGYTQQQMLKVSESKESFERALVLIPNNSRILRELSIINYELGEYEAAWRNFQRFRAVQAQLSAEMLLLGIQLATELGEREAKQDYVLALKNLYPDSREYESYRRDLEHLNSAEGR